MGSSFQSYPRLAYEATVDDGAGGGPVVNWGWLADLSSYQNYWVELFDESGDVLPWSESGYWLPVVELPPHYTDTDEGTLEWYVHLAGGLPGVFELALFASTDSPDSPSNVQTFQFDTRVIGPLPTADYSVATDTGPPPKQKFRFWPGKYAELVP